MIKKLKRKFIILATVSMFVLMSVLVAIMNIVNFSSVVSRTDRTLNFLSQREQKPYSGQKELPKDPKRDIKEELPRGISPEVQYESRYFTATVGENGEIEKTDISRIISVDKKSVYSYVEKAISKKSNRGFIEQFRYSKDFDDKSTRIIFLDCGRTLDNFYKFMWTAITVGFVGCVIVFLIFFFCADRIIRPIAESYDKQKRFITDAGHEIKTPLTVINANLDLLESDMGENESLTDIRTQTKHLGELTEELVYLSKIEETQNRLTKIEFPVSDIISETAQQFNAPAQMGNKNYKKEIEPGITMYGAPDSVSRLVSILLDNAMKYSPDKGTVALDTHIHKKSLIISVFNTTENTISNENLSHLFDRFYRTDESRNSETGGHGIGLSVAQAITAAHNGKITAQTQSGSDFKITVVLPLQ